MKSINLFKLNVLLCCFVYIIPILTNANQEEVEGTEADVLHALERSLDEATLTEDGMYEVLLPEDHVHILMGGTVALAGAAVQGTGLTPLRNWQEYLLDMSDGKNLDQKLVYLFENQHQFGLNMTHFAEGAVHTSDNLIRNGGYAITLTGPSISIFNDSENFLFIGKAEDGRSFMNVVERISSILTRDTPLEGGMTRPVFVGERIRLVPVEPPLAMINDVDYTMPMVRVYLDETEESRRILIRTVIPRTDNLHVAVPERYAFNARGRIVRKSSPARRFFTRLYKIAQAGRVPGMHALIAVVGLSPLVFSGDEDAQVSDEIPESIFMTSEEFQQVHESINSALDEYYSLQ